MAVGRVEMGDKGAIQSLGGPIKGLGVLFCMQWEATKGLNRISNCKVIPKILGRIILYVGKSNSI